MPNTKADFWKNKPLSELNHQEWESLCDGCGRCCLWKLEDEDTEEIYFTDVACRLLDRETCSCTDYKHRMDKVDDCLILSADKPEYYKILPQSCAYRRLAEGGALAAWHPLISGDPESVHQAGISVREMCVAEENVHPDDLEDRIIEFQDA